ncbi:MAG: hypothetical protein CL916_08800 [Deltaproteobacteria bacterium]|nr:hypothetical protein [Deltaproteobacteria bacterium]
MSMYTLAWCCFFMILGVFFWPFWMAENIQLLCGGATLLGLFWYTNHRLVLYTLCFVLGNVVVARMPEPSFYEGPIIADVQGRVCDGVLVYSNKGRFILRFFGDYPKEGERIAARVKSSRIPDSLPGEPDSETCIIRARASYARVKVWFPFENNERDFFDSKYQFVQNGGLLWSLMSGNRDFISEDTIDLLRKTGTAHFLAISGMHIGLVSAIVYGMARILCIPFLMFGLLSMFRILPCFGAMTAAVLYANHVGWPTSAQRSVCMVFFCMMALLFGKKVHFWTILALTACIIIYIEPSQLDSLSFRLSFSAVSGIIWFSPRVNRLIPLDAHPLFHRIGAAFAVSLGASLGTLPWVGLYFQEFPWIGVLCNIIVGPLLGGVAVPCALLGQLNWIGDIALIVGDAAIELSHFVLDFLVCEPLDVAFDEGDVVIIVIIYLFRRMDIHRIIALVLFIFFPRCVPSETQISFLSIGQGDCTLIEWKNGQVWLIDVGPSSNSLLRMLRRERISRIDHVFLSHPHMDHIGGLQYLIGEIDIGSLWTVRSPIRSEKKYLEIFQKVLNEGIEVRYPYHSPPSSVQFLHPYDGWSIASNNHVNEESFVFDISIEGKDILFTGDIGLAAENALLEQGRLLDNYDVVKVAHHGSRFSSGVEFVQAVHAEHAVIMCGRENRFGHPHMSTLFRWRNSKIWRTDEDGVVVFEPASEQFWSGSLAKP